MKYKIICLVSGGVLQNVYSDQYTVMDTDVIIVDEDNFTDGDPDISMEIKNLMNILFQIY